MDGTSLVGRDRERAALAEVVRRAADGWFGAVLVEGDAGLGKTSLVREACDGAAAQGAEVLHGSCLPLTSVSVPLVGLRTAVRAVPPAERPPGLVAPPEPDAGHPGRTLPLPVAFDEWLSQRARVAPVLLAVDDLHWADPETLDTLLYVLAGPAARQLSVLLTVRSSELGPGHHLLRWLADVRRFPAVRELVLGPLGRDEVAEEVADVLGAPAHGSLVDEVHARAHGNPYFTRLLVAGLDPSAQSLVSPLPEALAAAAVGPWHSLSEPARRLVQAVAVGGRPVSGTTLQRAAAAAGVGDPGPALAEAVASRMLDVLPDGGYWFHHPLQAEALEGTLLPEVSRDLHARFAAAMAEEAGHGDPDGGLSEAVSDHHARAGHPRDAYRWALRTAEAMRSAGDAGGRLRMLRRAVALVPDPGDGSAPTRVDLLEEVRVLARELGDWVGEHDAVEGLRAALAPDPDDLRLAVLDAWADLLRFRLGLPPVELGEARRRTAGAPPSSWERVVVLCESARMLLWESRVEPARAAVNEALARVEAVHPSGTAVASVAASDPATTEEWQRARAFAYAQAAMLSVFDEATGRAVDLARRAAAVAAEVRDGPMLLHATFWEANARPYPVRGWVETLTRGRELMERAGIPQNAIAWVSAGEALGRFDLGDPDGCRARLRVALGAGAGPAGTVSARLTAALLATWQGRQDEAEAHLARAEELFAGSLTVPGFHADAVTATVRLGRGDAAGSLEAALAAIERGGANPDRCEWLAPLASRALADLTERDRDAGRDPGRHLRRLGLLRELAPEVLRDTGEVDAAHARILEALDRLYDAETARAEAAPDAVERWLEAVDRLEAVPVPWDAAYACRRAAEALLALGGAVERRKAAGLLRRGHALAVRLGAAPTRDALEALARSARVSLTTVVDCDAVGEAPAASLTRREREVLAHVVAGRTYAEIATALFLSEKTVSSHISNILRKTGTANRVELAAWATRQGASS